MCGCRASIPSTKHYSVNPAPTTKSPPATAGMPKRWVMALLFASLVISACKSLSECVFLQLAFWDLTEVAMPLSGNLMSIYTAPAFSVCPCRGGVPSLSIPGMLVSLLWRKAVLPWEVLEFWGIKYSRNEQGHPGETIHMHQVITMPLFSLPLAYL